MGDMKTPDFDDLLAAFDIPDATGLDAKETIHGSQEEADSHLKHTGISLEESLQQTITTDVPAVSVIVKNTSRHESVVDSLAERPHSGTLRNGFRGQETLSEIAADTSSVFSKPFVSSLNGDSSGELLGKAPLQQKPDGSFSQPLPDFCPASCPSSEAVANNGNVIHPNEEKEYFNEVLMDQTDLDPPKKDESDKSSKNTHTDVKCNDTEISKFQESVDIVTDKTHVHSENSNELNSFEVSSKTANFPAEYSKSQSKLSSCLEALAALNARRDPSESAAVQNEYVKASPKVPISPGSPGSPLDAVKKLKKPSDSPVSVCSDNSGKASPAVMSASSPAIPRVRIKTIKTTSGHIKRTVTSVLPDSETDEVHSAYESSPCQSMISEDSYNMSPSQHVAVDSVRCATVRKSSPKIVLNKIDAIPRRLQPAVSLNKRRSTVHKGKKTKKSPAGSVPHPNFVPKAMHLASLNLVPHSVASSVASRSTCNQPSVPTLSTVHSSVPLVHQVKTASPCPPNTAAGTLNRLLNHANPVPTYMPDLSPPPESNISLPPRGYRCLECGDAFGVEKSLTFHYSRRSVHIEVTCTHCRKSLVFFNRCALLAHAREHKNSGTVMQCTQLFMKPIALEQMFIPLSADAPSVESCFFKSLSQKNQPAMPLFLDNAIRQRLHCVECNKQCTDLKTLAGHYQSSSEDTDGLTCKVCSMILPNKCSFRAHQRIHAHKSPYVCPECGVLSRSADIQNHVKENCLHYARKAWYKCLHCDLVFKSLQGQKSHIDEKHCEMFFKCSVCPVAFKTSDRCVAHLKNKHNASSISPQLIFKCSCETVFKKKHFLYQHFHEHANKRVTCIFKCPKCHSVFALKQQLMQHFKGAHLSATEKSWQQTPDRDEGQKFVQEKQSASSVKLTDGPQRKPESKARVKAGGWTCGHCLQWFPERDAYVSHVKSSHGKAANRFPCQHCDLSFSFASSLRKHIRKDHDGKRKSYVCWYCSDSNTTFTSSVKLKNHISLMHGIKNPDLGQVPTALSKESDRSSKGLGPGAAGFGVKLEKGPGGEEAPAAKRPKRGLRCAKCGFATDDAQEFERHIPQHKSQDSTPQCPRCGLCFTSAPARNRHLHIVHQVRETEDRGPQEDTVPSVPSGNRGPEEDTVPSGNRGPEEDTVPSGNRGPEEDTVPTEDRGPEEDTVPSGNRGQRA